jgi:hypothetical protein
VCFGADSTVVTHDTAGGAERFTASDDTAVGVEHLADQPLTERFVDGLVDNLFRGISA